MSTGLAPPPLGVPVAGAAARPPRSVPCGPPLAAAPPVGSDVVAGVGVGPAAIATGALVAGAVVGAGLGRGVGVALISLPPVPATPPGGATVPLVDGEP